MTTDSPDRPGDYHSSKIQSLSPKSYTNLKCQVEAASECDSEPNTTTTDFVINLPTEILPNIFTRMSFDELTTIKSVSRSWKDRVVTCSEAWSTLKLSKNTLKEFEPHISSIVPYVTELKLDGLSGDQCQSMFTQRVHGGHFKALQIVDIKTHELFTRHKQDQVDQFIIALQQIKDTIVELSLYITTTDDKHPVIPIEMVIETCTRLAKFHYIQYATALQQQQQHNASEMDSRPDLIDISVGFKSLDESILYSIMSRCPNLKYFGFYGCEVANTFDLLQQLPSNIVNISLNEEYYRLQGRKTNITVNRDNDYDEFLEFSSTGPGKITGLFGVAETLQDLEQVISNSSIEELNCFDVQLRSTPPSPLNTDCPIFSTTLHKLRSLVLYYSNDGLSTYDAFSIDILRRSPRLRSLSIYDCDPLSHELVNMVRQQAAHSLTELLMDSVFDAEDQQSVEDLFRDLAIISQQQQQDTDAHGGIQSLTLSNCGFNMDKIMGSIASIDTLENLDMQCCETSEGVMERFFEKLSVRRHCPSKLTRISMTCQDGITDKALEYINMLPSLKNISFWAQDEITENGVRPLKNNSQFQRVYISECKLIQGDIHDV